jgi:hypothetical protein
MPLQVVACSGQVSAGSTSRLLECDQCYRVARAKDFIDERANSVEVLVTNLNEDASSVGQ